MIELMFVLTTVFVAYVVYSIGQEKQRIDKAMAQEQPAKADIAPKREAMVTAESGSQTATSAPLAQPRVEPDAMPQKQAKATVKPAPTQARPTSTATAANAQESSGSSKSTIRNPKTGEVASLASNYRFMKRWVKEALVDEGLLDKIYKNNELDAEAEARIKQALLGLQEKEGYRA